MDKQMDFPSSSNNGTTSPPSTAAAAGARSSPSPPPPSSAHRPTQAPEAGMGGSSVMASSFSPVSSSTPSVQVVSRASPTRLISPPPPRAAGGEGREEGRDRVGSRDIMTPPMSSPAGPGMGGGRGDSGGEGGEEGGRHFHSEGGEEHIPIPDSVDGYEVSGTLFKKRGGWGKHLGWRPRAFTLYAGYMCYYEADSLREVEDKTLRHPRGWLRLEGGKEGGKEGGEAAGMSDKMGGGVEAEGEGGRGKWGFHVSSHRGHDNPPTEYVFTLVPPGGELSKWKVACVNRAEFECWIRALTAYLGPPSDPRTAGGREGGREGGRADALGASGGGGGGGGGRHHGHKHRRHSSSKDAALPPSPPPSLPSPSLPKVAGAVRKEKEEGMVVVEEEEEAFEGVAVLMVLNAACCWGRLVSIPVFIGMLICLNAVVVNAWLRWRAGGRKRARKVAVGGGVLPGLGESLRRKSQEAPVAAGDMALVPARFPPIGSTVRPAHACRKEEAREVEGEEGERAELLPERREEEGGGEEGGEGPEEELPEHTWSLGDAAHFKVRMGPNYRQTGRKEASGPALFTLLHLDIYKTPCRIGGIASLLPSLPPVPPTSVPPSSSSVPPLVIINCQLPSEAPVLLNMSEDGPGYNVIFYFACTEE
ncbi:hypothetical protein VYU27_009829, partial [Nannochloropsis oceanica]